MSYLLLAGATAAFYIMKLRTRPKGLKNREPQGTAVATVNSLPPDISLHKKINKYLSYSSHYIQITYMSPNALPNKFNMK